MIDEEWFNKTKDTVDLLRNHLNEDVMKKILWCYAIEDDPEERSKLLAEVDEILSTFIPRIIFSKKPVLVAPRRQESEGEISIGTVLAGETELQKFCITQDDLYNHIVGVSSPQHGKSTHIASVKSELLKKEFFWVSFDSKSDYAGLIKTHPEILVVDAHNDLRLNIFEAPPNVEPKTWRSLVIDALAHIGGWGHGVKGYLQNAVDAMVDERGDDFHIGHLYELIKSWSESSRISQDYRDVLLSRLALFNECKDVFWCSRGVPFEEIKWLVIRTHKVSIEVHSLIFEILLLREFTYRMVNNIKDESAPLKIYFVDEASKTSLSEAKEKDWTAREIGTPTITKFLTMARQFHLGVWASDQLYSKLSDSLKSVSSTKIIGRLNSGEDIEDVAKDISLSEDEKKAIRKLGVGEWIVRTGKISKPFLIRTDDFKIPRITDQEIESHMSQKRFWIESEKEVEEIKRSATSTLSQDEWYLLTNILSHPFKQFSNRLKVGMGKGRLEIAKQSLIQKGLASEKAVRLGAYRPWKILELTDDAIKLLESVGHPCGFWRHIKHEGLEHVLWKYLISDKLKQIGFEPIKEKKIDVEDGYRIVDIYWEDRGKKYACEIECSTVDISNKLRVLDKLDIFALAYSTDEVLNRASSWLAQNVEDYSKKVRVVLLSQYLKELQSLIGQDGSGLNSDPRTKGDSGSDETKGGLK